VSSDIYFKQLMFEASAAEESMKLNDTAYDNAASADED